MGVSFLIIILVKYGHVQVAIISPTLAMIMPIDINI